MKNGKESDVILKKLGYISAMVAVLLIFSTLFFGCSSKDEAETNETKKENNQTVSTSEKTTEKTTEVTEPESDNFFDGAVFVGDSVTLGLKNYVTSERNQGRECLGNAKFLAEGSMSYSNTLPEIGAKNSIHPRYNGTEMHIEDALALMNANKVFIMLGMNDFCIYPEEQAMANAKECTDRIKEKNPDIDIYIESVTPALFDSGKFSNENINKFDVALKNFCDENGYTYVDVASAMKDENGILISSYCGDPGAKGVHMSNIGCKAWVDYLNKICIEEK